MLALRPAVADFIDTVVSGRDREMQLENVDIGKNPRLVGLTVKAAHNQTGITILAIQKKNKLMTNPADEEAIEEDDRLIVIGTKQQLAALEKVLAEASPNR
jgi:K+/H+ antiporter YhaU regulatory subunit KhtT